MKIKETGDAKREQVLLAKIAILEEQGEKARKQLQQHERIITCLAYRYIIENLPPREGKQESTAWGAFWKEAVQQANEGKDSPVTRLTQRFGRIEPTGARNVEQVGTVGGGLYSVLSTNIHNHTRGTSFDYDPNQWNEMDGDIFEALKPKHVQTNGTIDWELERLRFVDPGRPKVKKITREVKKECRWIISPKWNEILDGQDVDASIKCWPSKTDEKDLGIVQQASTDDSGVVRTNATKPLEDIARDWMGRANHKDPKNISNPPATHATYFKSVPPGYAIYERGTTKGPLESPDYIVYGRPCGTYGSILEFSEHLWYLFIRKERKDITSCSCVLCSKAEASV